jgi:hypothetical protein
MDQLSRLYTGGIPTGPDVAKIRKIFASKENTPGAIILYEDIECTIGFKRDNHRFRVVTVQWRKEVERDTGLIIGCERNVGFRVLEASGKLELAKDKMHSGIRAVKRSIVVADKIDRRDLSGMEQQQLDALQRRQVGIATAAQIRTNVPLPSIM